MGPHLTRYIVGLDEAESQDLLDTLYEHMTRPEFVWTHRWRVGDLIMWDNRPTMHSRKSFPDSERRVMKRTQVFNDEIPIPG